MHPAQQGRPNFGQSSQQQFVQGALVQGSPPPGMPAGTGAYPGLQLQQGYGQGMPVQGGLVQGMPAQALQGMPEPFSPSAPGLPPGPSAYPEQQYQADYGQGPGPHASQFQALSPDPYASQWQQGYGASRGAPGTRIIWEFEVGDGKWKPYADDCQDYIERSWMEFVTGSGKERINVNTSGIKLSVDFNLMNQMKLDTHKRSPIRRSER